jgi:hypothetical protein
MSKYQPHHPDVDGELHRHLPCALDWRWAPPASQV